ncbi:uncharacterized protein LOC130253407 [Oenanthe melanoleuca]|uniref:uncharacterized protein LOC130253407 n=1 Tax=Oenanthe melanoleuca TaxID=2939378 RepID=UPI0024C1213F|nr:uncharacterized protein LOC130253407 [Oenanthe melanoleuca]
MDALAICFSEKPQFITKAFQPFILFGDIADTKSPHKPQLLKAEPGAGPGPEAEPGAGPGPEAEPGAGPGAGPGQSHRTSREAGSRKSGPLAANVIYENKTTLSLATWDNNHQTSPPTGPASHRGSSQRGDSPSIPPGGSALHPSMWNQHRRPRAYIRVHSPESLILSPALSAKSETRVEKEHLPRKKRSEEISLHCFYKNSLLHSENIFKLRCFRVVNWERITSQNFSLFLWVFILFTENVFIMYTK